MKRVNYYQTETVTICPYCVSERDSDFGGCCGESSAHYETATLYQDEIYLEGEIETYKPIIEMFQYEINRRLKKRYWNLKKRQFRDLICKVYDGSFWYKGQNYKSPCVILRRSVGFQWSKLDCLILRQLHDFPLYYTSPEECIRLRQKAKETMAKFNVSK